MKISFHSNANKTNFHDKNFALSLAFIMRLKATRKWSIVQLGREGRGQNWGEWENIGWISAAVRDMSPRSPLKWSLSGKKKTGLEKAVEIEPRKVLFCSFQFSGI